MGRLKPGVSLDRAQQELDAIFRQAYLEGARSPSAELHRESIAPQARAWRYGGRQRSAGNLCAVAASPVEPPRRGPAARQLERRHAVAFTVRGEAAGDRDTPRARRGAMADRPAVPHRVDAARRDRGRNGSAAVLVGQPDAPSDRDVGRGSAASGSWTRYSHPGLHHRALRIDVCAVRPHPRVARHLPVARHSREPPDWRRPAAPRRRSRARRLSGCDFARAGGRWRAVPSQPGQHLGAGHRLRSDRCRDVLGRRTAVRQARPRRPGHVPAAARRAAERAGGRIGQRVRRSSGQRRVLLR